MASAFSGQAALRPLPDSNNSTRCSVANYESPPTLKVSQRKTMKDSATAGIDVLKVTKYGKLQARRIALSNDNRSIFVTTNRIKSFRGLVNRGKGNQATAKGIDVSTIDRIHRGQQTKRFLLARAEEPSVIKEEHKCLSIVYLVPSDQSLMEGLANTSKQKSRFETLDLLVPNDADYKTLVSVLEDLLSLWNEERKYYDQNVLLLQYHWLDMGKELSHNTLSCSEFVHLCDKLNIPLKKSHLSQIYKDFCKELETEELNMDETGELVNDIKTASLHMMGLERQEDDPLSALFTSILKTDPVPSTKMSPTTTKKGGGEHHLELEIESDTTREPTISAVAFLSFVRSNQKEYKTQLEHVLDLFATLNRQTTWEYESKEFDEIRNQRLDQSRFISYLQGDGNDIMDPDKGRMTQNKMFQPITHYWVNTSHDTYLAKLSSSTIMNRSNREMLQEEAYYALDVQSYQNALYRGVRCIELDTWDGVTVKDDAIVARRPELLDGEERLVPGIPFSNVLRVVRDFLESNPDSFPVILCIENHCSLKFQDYMAQHLHDILGAANLLYTPRAAELMNSNKPLPTPENLRGLAVIKSKRPKDITEGATVLNDDFDDDNDYNAKNNAKEPMMMEQDEDQDDDDDDDDDKVGIVVGFDASGPIMSNEAGVLARHPSELLSSAIREKEAALSESRKTALRANELSKEATEAEALATKLMSEIGMNPDDLNIIRPEDRSAAAAKKREPPDALIDQGTEVDLDTFKQINEISTKKSSEGLEVQEFFADSVNRAKWNFTEADAEALEAAEKAALAQARLNKAKEAHADAEVALEESHIMAAKTSEASRKAAADARAKREHADTARQRVETVRSLLKTCKESASSAETVVVTAVAEAKISEQRASEAESRAARAMSTAEKDRARSDDETRKEEKLERVASAINSDLRQTEKDARDAHDRLDKATGMLDRVNEQLKLIETSTQYKREKREADLQQPDGNEPSPRHASRFLSKHAAKLEERDVCMTLIKEAKQEVAAKEVELQRLETMYDSKAREWKAQADIAMTARRKADRSSHTAEELAEHADEEREAATLRHVACEKAKRSVQQKGTNRTSVEEQLAEASRASADAASLAVESRKRAEQLAKDAALAKDHTRERQNVEEAVKAKQEAQKAYEDAMAEKDVADEKAADAKRLLDTSSEVLSNAKREAVAEIHRANAERLAQRTAVHAYEKALLTRQQADQAKTLRDMAKQKATEKEAAADHAKEYKGTMEQVAHISTALAKLTFLHSTKRKTWAKSLTLPTSHMHSLPQQALLNTKEEESKKRCVEFTMNHFCRSFPSWKTLHQRPFLNNDPVVQWGLGVQLVSMNSACADEYLLLSDGRFRENGSCGYVLKPEHLIDDTIEEVPEVEELWRFQVLSGSCIPKPESSFGKKAVPMVGSTSHSVSPFVKVSLHDGIQQEESSQPVHRTKVSRRNGLNPVWNGEEFDFLVKSPSVAMVSFSVWEKRQDGVDDFIAAASVPVSCMREGYRSVPLFDSLHTRCGAYAFASITVKSQKMKVA